MGKLTLNQNCKSNSKAIELHLRALSLHVDTKTLNLRTLPLHFDTKTFHLHIFLYILSMEIVFTIEPMCMHSDRFYSCPCSFPYRILS